MEIAFAILALVTLVSAVGAMFLRNLVHCVLCLVVTFAGMAGFFLQLNAQFAGFAQVLVYIGAVAVLMIFALLLTRGADAPGILAFSKSWKFGAAIVTSVFLVLAGATIGTPQAWQSKPQQEGVTVKEIGRQLMTTYILPLEVIGLLLTAAMLGAVVIAMPDSARRKAESDEEEELIETPANRLRRDQPESAPSRFDK